VVVGYRRCHRRGGASRLSSSSSIERPVSVSIDRDPPAEREGPNLVVVVLVVIIVVVALDRDDNR